MINFDKVLGFHAHALNLRAQRSEIIANNLANVDTPNFKARDIDFKQAMQQFSDKTQGMSGDNPRHFSANNDPLGLTAIKFRLTPQTSIDGNTVDKDIETVSYAKNSVDYQTSLTFINGSIKGLRSAIKGE